MLTGKNGILNRATEAKEKTELSQKKEEINLKNMEDIINDSLSNTVVEKVTDKNPGVLENDISDSDIYIINSIEDLIFFSYDVRNGNTYIGKTVKLGINLDFSSSKSYVDAFRTDYGMYGYNGELKTLLTSLTGFIPIGTVSNVNKDSYTFAGTFDGNGKKIINLYLNVVSNDNQNDLRIGFFGNNNGKIKRLGIENCNINGTLDTNGNNTVIVGGVVGYNYGNIEECFVSGNIKCEGKSNAKCRAGGLAGTLSGNIKNCYNKANINGKGKIANCIGGISGNINNDFSIEYCYNAGSIILDGNGKEDSEVHSIDAIGGITGYTNADSKINNIYNIGNVTLNNGNGYEMDAGGIVGYAINFILVNGYNTGKINANASKINIGGIAGSYYGTNGSITNAFYSNKDINGIGIANQTNTTIKVEKDEDMPKIIDIIGNAFKLDNKNSIYPILNWQ